MRLTGVRLLLFYGINGSIPLEGRYLGELACTPVVIRMGVFRVRARVWNPFDNAKETGS